MTSRVSRALALFDAYVGMSPTQRRRALADLQREDPGVHDTLASLLASDDALHGVAGQQHLLDSPPEALLARHASDDDRPDPRIGTRKGPWRIERMIGAGGMGTVYEARRDDGQYQQRVALKCIRLELSSERVLEGFRREREILAGLDHPNIATLFDGGVDEDGAPWFAMRYVDGAPIDEWCDQRKLPLRARVALLVHACDALAYAHRHMVLHQDIKPSNLLVTEDGQLQLLDFGLAASLSAGEHMPRIAISEGYTAPEAVSGAPPSTTMDVWSMGIVMYRLLCGSLPATSRLLLACDADARPVSPMSRLASQADDDANAQRRGLQDAHSLGRQLAGDLDAIAARCIAASPDERYPSVAALRDDLERWLHSRPVAARDGGAGYRLSRFLSRHRLAAGLTITAALALTLGGGIAAWHAQRAAQEAESSAALSRIFEQTLGTATLSGLGDAPFSSSTLLQDTEQRVRALSLQEHPRVLALGLSSLARSHAVAGHYEHATRLAEEAASLLGNDPTSRAAAHAAMSNLLGRPSEALEIARAALPHADNASRIRLMAEISHAHWNLAEYDDASQALDAALDLAKGERDTASQAELLTLRGYRQMRHFRFPEADADLARAMAMATPGFPLVANEARRVAAQSLQQQERFDESGPLIEESLATARRILGEDHPATARAWSSLAQHQCFGGQHEDCAESIARAEAIVLAQQGDQHPDYADVLRVRSYASSFGRQSFEEGIRLLREAERITSASYPPTHESIERIRMMMSRRLIITPQATPEQRRHNFDEGLSTLETLVADPRRAGLPAQPIFRSTLAEAYLLRNGPGDMARAQRMLAENIDVLRAFHPGYSGHFNHALLSSLIAFRQGQLDRAEARLAELMPTLEAHQDSSNNRYELRNSLLMRAEIAQARGDTAQVRLWLQRSLSHVEDRFGADHPAINLVRERIKTFEATGKIPPRIDPSSLQAR